MAKKEAFVIQLDTAFLRYLQAMDPYVIVYSEVWRGVRNYAPADKSSDNVLRQVVLLKAGLARNANLPLTNVPLAGPMKLDVDKPVTVAVKVVVLTKSDNEQTIALLDGVATAFGTAMPQYQVAAGAAAAVAKVVVSQNRDKIEFEHTITFYPKSVGTQDSQATEPHGFDATLQPGRLVIVKGEDHYRQVGVETFWLDLIPFNWFGHRPDIASQWPQTHREVPLLGWSPDTWPSLLWYADHLPFWIVEGVFSPPLWGTHNKECPLPPEKLALDGNTLARAPGKEDDDSKQPKTPYAEKSYFVIEVAKVGDSTGTSIPTFESLVTDAVGNKDFINGLLGPDVAASAAASVQAIQDAGTKLTQALLVQRTQTTARSQVARGTFSPDNLTSGTRINDKEQVNSIVEDGYTQWADKESAICRDLVNRLHREAKKTPPQGKPEDIPGAVIAHLNRVVLTCPPTKKYKEYQKTAWRQVLTQAQKAMEALNDDAVTTSLTAAATQWQSLIDMTLPQ